MKDVTRGRNPSNLGFAEEAAVFKGATQNARVLSEGWIAANGFCPSCGAAPPTAFAADSPVADFHCGVCAEEYELEATKGRIDRKLVNGAYGAMKARLAAANNPRCESAAIPTFVIPGGGALAPQTRNKAARDSAKLSRTRLLTHRLRFAAAPPCSGSPLRCARNDESLG